MSLLYACEHYVLFIEAMYVTRGNLKYTLYQSLSRSVSREVLIGNYNFPFHVTQRPSSLDSSFAPVLHRE
jgi:hypothetical protein